MKQTAHITHVIDHLGAGGAQRLLSDLVTRQQRNTHSVSVICLRTPTPLSRNIEQAGVPVYYLAMKRNDPRQLMALSSHLKRLKPHIVHAHLTLSGLLGPLAARLVGIPAIVVHDHESSAEIYITPGPMLALRRLIERRVSPGRLRYIVISRSALEYAKHVRRIPAEFLALVPNGVNIAQLEQGRVPSARARTLLKLPSDVRLIGCAGRLAPEKGIDTLLTAVSRLEPDVHLLLAGRGPLEQSIRNLIHTSGLAERVHMLGYLDDLRPALCACDLYVQPSRREAFGLAAAEASALGLPVVASGVGGLSDVVVHGQTGIITPPDDARALAAALQSLLQNRETAKAMGAAGRQHTALHFDINIVIRQLEEVYQELLR